ncbi:MAG: methylated-DNA--[protein]-cysteine S-methyltransferase [Casimicrobiaceae bacterium]
MSAMIDDNPATLRHALGPTSLGTVLVAHSAHGLVAILIGDADEPLVRDLQRRFPTSPLSEGASDGYLAAVTAMIDGREDQRPLPLDMRGTPFQRRVWDALRAIPPDATQSYTDIARSIGAPAAVRAVAGACAANPLAVAIPCHRALRRDGGLSGYRWGVARKRALLAREAAR